MAPNLLLLSHDHKSRRQRERQAAGRALVSAGRCALVVGAYGDIGRALTKALSSRGCSVIGWDIKERPNDSNVDWGQVDICSDRLPTEKLSAQLRKHGELAYVFHIVGGTDAEELRLADPACVPLEVADRTLRLNLLSAFNVLNVTLPVIRAATGDRSYTFVSSTNALGGYGAAAYSAAKAGLHGLVKSLAVPLGMEGIRINAVALGTTATANFIRVRKAAGRSGELAELGSRTPRGTVLSADEAASALIAIGVESAAITGVSVVADAGQSILRPSPHR